MDFYNVPFGLPQDTLFNVLAFKTVAQTNLQRWGGMGESKTFTLRFGSVDCSGNCCFKQSCWVHFHEQFNDSNICSIFVRLRLMLKKVKG